MGQFGTMYKVRLTEFLFECIKGYTVTEFKDLFLQRNSCLRRNGNIILPRPETNLILKNSILYREPIAWSILTNKETSRAKTLRKFKRCLAKYDADKMNFETTLATTNSDRDIGYKYFKQFLIFNCTFVFRLLLIFLVIVVCTTPLAMLIFLSC